MLVGAGDGADVAVEDAEVVAVAEAEHAVADAVAVIVDDRDERAELIGCFEQGVQLAR